MLVIGISPPIDIAGLGQNSRYPGKSEICSAPSSVGIFMIDLAGLLFTAKWPVKRIPGTRR
jgi:hypothetical protein